MKETLASEKTIKHPRIAGIFFIVVGEFLVYLGLIQPVREISQGKAEVSYSLGAATIGVLATLLGLVLLITGNKYAVLLTTPMEKRSKRARRIFFVVCFAFGMLSYLAMTYFLQMKGYADK
jgi:hypothetical protein